MDLTTLQNTLTSALKTDKRFTLAGSALGVSTAPVPDFFARFFRTPNLVLSAASVSATTATPSISGTLAGSPQAAYSFLNGFHVDATFSLDVAGTVQLALMFTPPAGKIDNWGLLDVLPGYKTTFLADFTWSNARFSFDTQNPATLPDSFPTLYGLSAVPASIAPSLQKGMTFKCDILYSGNNTGFQWLLGTKVIGISGPIEWSGDQPQFDLVSGLLVTLNLESFTLPVSIHIVAALFEFPATTDRAAGPLSLPLGVLSSALGLPAGSQSFDIPYYILASSGQTSQVTVIGNFSDASSLALSDVSRLLGVTSLDSQQSPDFPTLQGLALKTITLGIDISTRQLIKAAATVAYTPPGGTWQPFGDLLTFEEISVTFAIMGPFASPSFETDIVCDATLAGGQLEASISLPSLDFSCELLDGDTHPIDLTQILDAITGNAFTTATPDFKLLCTQLKVLGGKSSNCYRFQATVSDDWSFDVLGAKFALSSIGFDISHIGGTTSTTTGQVVAQLTLANVPVQISASYQNSQSGWSFSGGTVGGLDISLSALVDDSLSLFGLSLPSTAPHVSISSLQMMLSTGNMDFGFSCEGRIEMVGQTMEIGIDLGRTHDNPDKPGDATTTFHGYLEINGQTFQADFNSGATDNNFSFGWVDATAPLQFEDISTAFGFALPDIPKGLDLALKSATFKYDFTKEILVLEADSANYGKAVFVALKNQTTSKWQFFFGLSVGASINLSNLPLINKVLSADETVAIDKIQVLIASATLDPAIPTDQTEITAINNLIDSDYPKIPAQGLPNEVAISADFDFGGCIIPLSIGAGGGQSSEALAPAGQLPALSSQNSPTTRAATGTAVGTATGTNTGTVAKPTRAADGATWFSVQKNFGPVNFQKVGVKYKDGVLWFLLDASLTAAGLEISVLGLSVGSPLTDFSPEFNIEGLGLDFQNAAVTIEGSFVKLTPVAPVTLEFGGSATIQLEEFGISAIGSYAQFSGNTSMFVFASVNGPFGGPGFFFVTGFSGGFGYNSKLRIPGQNEVFQFPFVQAMSNPDALGNNPGPTQVLENIMGGANPWVSPAAGDIWLAAGIKFTTYEMVNSSALLVAEFNKDFLLALIGISKARFPMEGSTVYAYVELQLEALFEPDAGIVSFTAVLSPNSYVLDPACHLTGGFAMCFWFGANQYSGDFVLTLGGYSPYYKAPSYYPQEPRLGFSWALDSSVSISGGLYFALTPAAVMAGGNLDVLYHSGNLKAWFTAHADIIIWYNPFHFLADIGVSVGASYKVNFLFCSKTFTVELGANLTMWGPSTGGTVTIHWFIISFTVDFGASQSSRLDKQTWEQFSKVLPAPADAVKIVAVTGLMPTPASPGATGGTPALQAQATPEPSVWIVRKDHFQFTTNSTVPLSELYIEGDATPRKTATTLVNIKPMQATGLSSKKTLSIISKETGKNVLDTSWSIEVATSNIPDALWGTGSNTELSSAPSLIVNQLSGFQITVPAPVLGSGTGDISIKEGLQYDPITPGTSPLQLGLSPVGSAPTVSTETIADIEQVMSLTITNQRNALFASIGALGIEGLSNGDLTALAQNANAVFSDEPMLIGA